MSQLPEGPVYLTPDGRQRLEEQAARYAADVAAWRSGGTDETTTEERGDAAERLIEADDLVPAQDLLAATRSILSRALPMPEGPDDGIVRLGSTVTVRDEQGVESRYMIVDPAEVADREAQVSSDSPVGHALLGRARGSQVAIDVPAGRQVLTVQLVEPYRLRTP